MQSCQLGVLQLEYRCRKRPVRIESERKHHRPTMPLTGRGFEYERAMLGTLSLLLSVFIYNACCYAWLMLGTQKENG